MELYSVVQKEESKKESENNYEIAKVAIAKGDGIGPEIMNATLDILKEAGARIEVDEIEIGEKVYLSGNSSGISKESWDIIRSNKVLLKAPITTPQGGGYKSLNVTMRKSLGLFANVRPCKSLYPYVDTKHPDMDLVIIRENEEDLYAGIEHQQTQEVVQCLKLVSVPGCERIVRYAFEYASKYNRKRVTCFTKDNIMKQTDGLFHKIFIKIAKEYPHIKSDHYIVDIAMARLADTPEDFDVIVMPNLYGDIASDIAAQIAGSVGLAGSSNIGEQCAMFEAIHGSAPDIANKNIANPSGLIQASVAMLKHLGQFDIAEKVQNAWLKTIEDGYHTADIFKEGTSKQLVTTREFKEVVIQNLGQLPKDLKAVSFKGANPIKIPKYKRESQVSKELQGSDIFVDWKGSNPDELAEELKKIENNHLELIMITNRGVKVWPNGFSETHCTDHWRCRFFAKGNAVVKPNDIIEVLQKATVEQIDIIKTENLYSFDGQRAYSLGQGQ